MLSLSKHLGLDAERVPRRRTARANVDCGPARPSARSGHETPAGSGVPSPRELPSAPWPPPETAGSPRPGRVRAHDNPAAASTWRSRLDLRPVALESWRSEQSSCRQIIG